MMMQNKIINIKELRKYQQLPVEIRATATNEESRIISGYAVKYNMRSEIMCDYWGDQFVEEFAPGAFDEALQRGDQKCLWNHDSNYPLGAVRANTLSLTSDNDGLHYEADVPRNTWGNDALESIGRGDVDGSSFMFRALNDQWSMIDIDGDEIYKRTIIKADIYEVSPTTFPAYPDSEVNVREFKEHNDIIVGEVKHEVKHEESKQDAVREVDTDKLKKAILKTYL